VQNRNVTCTRENTNRYGRMVGVCTVSGTKVNRWLVEQGHALLYVEYGGGVYRDVEQKARAGPRGGACTPAATRHPGTTGKTRRIRRR